MRDAGTGLKMEDDNVGGVGRGREDKVVEERDGQWEGSRESESKSTEYFCGK